MLMGHLPASIITRAGKLSKCLQVKQRNITLTSLEIILKNKIFADWTISVSKVFRRFLHVTSSFSGKLIQQKLIDRRGFPTLELSSLIQEKRTVPVTLSSSSFVILRYQFKLQIRELLKKFKDYRRSVIRKGYNIIHSFQGNFNMKSTI